MSDYYIPRGRLGCISQFEKTSLSLSVSRLSLFFFPPSTVRCAITVAVKTIGFKKGRRKLFASFVDFSR